jgi:hypothetical protein
VNQRIRWVENEVIALTKGLEAIRVHLNQWKQNDERGLSPAIPVPSVRAVRLSVNGMRGNLNDLGEILDRIEAEDILDSRNDDAS